MVKGFRKPRLQTGSKYFNLCCLLLETPMQTTTFSLQSRQLLIRDSPDDLLSLNNCRANQIVEKQ